MRIPPSPHFTPLTVAHVFNADRTRLDGGLAPRATHGEDWSVTSAYGAQTLRGIPFALGEPGLPNVVLLDRASGEVRIETGALRATYLVFLHAVENQVPDDPFAPFPAGGVMPGNGLGDWVSDYVLCYADGTEAATRVTRRLAIQQRHISWGASPFAAVPALGPSVYSTTSEDVVLRRVPVLSTEDGVTRAGSVRRSWPGENLWLYALPNPHPDRPIDTVVLRPRDERSIVYGVTATAVSGHPLRPGVRQKLRLTLPDGVALNHFGELDTDDRDPTIGIDLGTVISARVALEYDDARWSGAEADVQPAQSSRDVVVEYAAHPQGRLYLDAGAGAMISSDLPEDPGGASGDLRLQPVGAAERPVTIRVIDRTTRQAVPVRLHLHGAAGEYLPPRGHHRKVNPFWFQDTSGEFVNGRNQYAYIDGECVVDLPLGTVFVEISRGHEIAPIRTAVEVTPETGAFTFELERTLPWRERGWVTADTHVHFLSPQTALLEGAAEGVNVVNLLASQWGEMFSNVADFDGRTTLGACDFGGDGEFLVRVGTENRMHVLGHVSLLGYSGPMVQPLCTGGPAESAIGDPQEVTMAEWAARCIEQGGLVVSPHGPNPNAERAADIVLGLVHAIELMTFNPHDAQLNAFGLADWYRYQNLGYQIPLTGGSDKMSAESLLGGVRTYAHLGDRAFTFQAWMDAVRAGNTFATVGPLIEFAVEGTPAGGRITLPTGGGTVQVTWTVESVRCPVDLVEVVGGGRVVEQVSGDGLASSGHVAVPVPASTWIALRVRGSLSGKADEVAAHSSAVQVLVDGSELFSEIDAVDILAQIEGTIAYVDTIAPRPDAQRFKRLRATLESAHNRLHGRLHAQGLAHRHTPIHLHDAHQEH